ncbi:hypothetical protein BAUCODRAFT_21143 [Baudoinia panamericana UAMH 10762]|uniref:Uncharacterized protein n=1 Tax=Baudoinia panamericana (strain UAMH 10762) TaxID=717646 RepID=M2MW50_BAUPA|nr:uncharacterized protein BAUCODRAFT_21143 [Baudoinia panamericana UAMH 10762]EMD01212.1 hypothetical protein BAUCODRAFT_21143 [Baudoinia panamericana UAMH 10762]
MAPLEQLYAKFEAERTHQSLRQQQHPTPPFSAPPPYTASDEDSDTDFESDSSGETTSPFKLTINAAHSIQGSNNIVPTSSTLTLDATKLSTILVAALTQLNGIATSAETNSTRARALKVELTVNCGVTVIGDRNVVGHMGVKPRFPQQQQQQQQQFVPVTAILHAGNSGTGAKRKAEEDVDKEREHRKCECEGEAAV